MGPQGTGAICVRPGVHVEPLKVGGSGILTFQKEHPGDMPEALEAGTLNSHGIAGLRAALEWIQETGVNQIREKEQMLMWRFYDQVKKIPGVTVYGDFSSSKLCAFVVSSSCVYRDALKLKFCVPDIRRER